MPQNLGWCEQAFAAIVNNVGQVVKGTSEHVRVAVLALFAEGHVLLDDTPEFGKTALARSVSASITGSWNRTRFTPDLVPADVIGERVFNESNRCFDFHRGPIFSNVVLADGIDRATSKVQSALLRVMDETEITVDGRKHFVPKPFVVIATQSPVDREGVSRLPESHLDRFMVKLPMGSAHQDVETDMGSTGDGGDGVTDVSPIATIQEMASIIGAVRRVHVEAPIRNYIDRLCDFTQHQLEEVRLGLTPRGATALTRMARAMAASQGRDTVGVDDVRTVAPYVMSHRLLLTPSAEGDGISPEALVARALDKVSEPEALRA